jgi:hypothetical protein
MPAKIIYRQPPPTYIRMEQIPLGTFFTGTIHSTPDQKGLFVRAFNIVVSLDDPMRTWVAGSVGVHHYQPVSVNMEVSHAPK